MLLSKIFSGSYKKLFCLENQRLLLEAYGKKAKNGVILIDLLSEEEYEARIRIRNVPITMPGEVAMNIKGDKPSLQGRWYSLLMVRKPRKKN